jgi:hypothetical protein
MTKKKKPQLGSTDQPTDNRNELDQNELDRADSTTAILEPATPDGRNINESMSRDDGQMPQRPEAGDDAVSPIANEEVQGKTWGDPYKAIFTCPEMGFELGENRRFKQRIFHFIDKPTEEILAELKENKFVYRGTEKAWTIPANAQTRKLSDDLARKWAGLGYAAGIER